MLYKTLKTLDHPPQSPDLNPIEHLWEHLDHKIWQRQISSKDVLKAVIYDEWNKITPKITKKLVTSMSNRLSAVMKAKGKQTKY